MSFECLRSHLFILYDDFITLPFTGYIKSFF